MTRNYNAAEDKGGLKQLFSSLKLFRNRSLKKGKGNDSASKIKSTNDTFKEQKQDEICGGCSTRNTQKGGFSKEYDNLTTKKELMCHSRSNSSSLGSYNTASTSSFNTTISSVAESFDLSDGLEQDHATKCKLLSNDYKTPSSLCLLSDSLYDIDEELGYPSRQIVNYWKEKEVAFQKSRTINLGYAEQIQRRYAVDWIRNLGDDLHLQAITIQSAMSIFDEAMWSCDCTIRDWRLLAACSLNMAAKYEEAESSMPMVSEIAEVSGMVLTTRSVTQGELRLAEALSWNLSRITPMHFLDYYMHSGVIFNGDLCRGLAVEEGKVSQYVKKYVHFFANLSQQDPLFLKFIPSVLAAAVIMATRQVICISPLWREELVNLTSYTGRDIIECEKGLWGCYVRTFPNHCALRLN